MSATRYPLSWPAGWKRAGANRRRASFGSKSPNGYGRLALTVAQALSRMLGEFRRLGVREGDVLISTNIRTRIDGLPYADEPEPKDPGVAVYFRLKQQDRVLACDTWTRVADNIAAIAAHVEAMRAIERYGVGSLDQAFAGYQALPPRGSTWRSSLGFAPDQVVTVEAIETAFRQRAREAHPDVAGGSHDAMASLTQAKAEALAELRGGGTTL